MGTITREVVKQAMKDTQKDIRLSKVVREGKVKKENKFKVKIVGGDYCECSCKGQCDTRELKITKNKRSKTIGISSYVDELLKVISKKKCFEFEIVIK